jgi:hypothetical protein
MVIEDFLKIFIVSDRTKWGEMGESGGEAGYVEF